MKKASMILGIVGGILSIIAAIVFFCLGSIFSTDNVELLQRYDQERSQIQENLSGAEEKLDGKVVDIRTKVTDTVIYLSDTLFSRIEGVIDSIFRSIRNTFYTIGAIWLSGGILGVVGGSLAKKHNKLAGIMMLIASLAGFTKFLILMLGGLFALSKDHTQEKSTKVLV